MNSSVASIHQQKSIEIPTRDGSEVVEVFLDELPEEAEEICEILIAEEAPIELFQQFALEYYRRGQKHAFIVLVKRGLSEAKMRRSNQNEMLVKLNSLLAAHYIAEGVALPASEKKRSNDYLVEATECLNEAENRTTARVQPEEINLRKGLMLLAKNSIEPAGLVFKICLEKNPNSPPALLGQACFHYFSGNYRAALSNFQQILKIYPSDDIILAMGYCYLNLGFKEMAQKAFSHILSLSPGNEAAMQALGFLHLDSEKDLQSGLLQMKRVYELNRSNSLAQIHLANHFFFKKDLVKAKALAEGALSSAPFDKNKAEAYFILAKISHVSGNFAEALGNYQLASKLAPEFLPALYGLGQCFLARSDLDGALMMFEKIAEKEPNCPEVLRLLTLIYCSKLAQTSDSEQRSELTQKASKLLPKALELFPADLILMQCAASVYESVDSAKALNFYSNSGAQESTNFAVLNNFVVLNHLSKTAERNLSMDSGIELIRKAQSCHGSGNVKLFLKFNEARLLEENSQETAEEIYKQILKDESNFVWAHLRLGILCFRRGQISEATDHFKDALGTEDQNRDAWNCLAAINLKQKAFTPARKSFERVLQTIDKNDPYALVALGNIYIELARQDKSRKHFDDYHKRAGEFFGKALTLDRGSLYAAQGIGLIYADRGMAAEARDVFTQVRAAQGASPSLDSTLNQAHALTEMGKYAAAVTLYTAAIENPAAAELSNGKSVSLLLYRCRARYLLALESADFSSAESAIEDARRASQMLPSDEPLKFNLGLLLQARASAIRNNRDISSESFDLFASAIDSLSEAEGIFKSLQDSAAIDVKLLESRLSLCGALVKQIQERSSVSEKALKEQVDRLEQLRLQREAQAQKDLRIQAQKEAEERQKMAEIDRTRAEMAAKMRETEEKVKAATYKVPSKSSKADDSDDASTDDDGEDSENGEGEQKVKKPRKKRVKSAAGSEDELDGVGIVTSRTRRSKANTTSAPLLSKEFISSSEEDEIDDQLMSSAVENDDENEEDGKAPL